jgi:flagellar biosynthesis chaperone FliJ
MEAAVQATPLLEEGVRAVQKANEAQALLSGLQKEVEHAQNDLESAQKQILDADADYEATEKRFMAYERQGM